MKPVEFKHQNMVFAKDQPEYQPLPALKLDSPQGEVIACWKMDWKERLKVLITGKVWVNLLSFNKPLTPSYVTVHRKEVFSAPEDSLTNMQRLSQWMRSRQVRWGFKKSKHSPVSVP